MNDLDKITTKLDLLSSTSQNFILPFSSFFFHNSEKKAESLLSINFYYLQQRGHKLWRNLLSFTIVKFGRHWERYIVKQALSDFLPRKKTTEIIMSHIKEVKSTGLTGKSIKSLEMIISFHR